MKYFFDTEFHEYPKQATVLGIKVGKPVNTIELISIGIVAGNGREYYAICKDFDLKAAWNNEWLRKNVLKDIYDDFHSQTSTHEKTHYYQLFEPFSYGSLKYLLKKHGQSREQIAKEVLSFCSNGYFDRTGLELSEAVKYELYENFKPEFYAYYADYDWVVFCWLWGSMMDLPRGFPMYCRDLKQIFDERAAAFRTSDFFTAFDFKNEGKGEISDLEKVEHLKKNVRYPDQKNEHNALADAKWNKELFEFINNLDNGI